MIQIYRTEPTTKSGKKRKKNEEGRLQWEGIAEKEGGWMKPMEEVPLKGLGDGFGNKRK